MTGGRLENVGSMNIPLNVAGGTVAVGPAQGTTLISGDFTLGALATLSLDSVTLNQAAVHDRLAVTGIVNLGGTLSLEGDFGPVGVPLTILDNQGTAPIVGNFLGLPEGSTFSSGGSQFQITYAGGTGNDVVVSVVVPEPASLGAIVLAMAGLLGGRRSRRRARG